MDSNTLLFDIDKITQDFAPEKNNKEMYGEVNTPFHLIHEMLNLFPKSTFQNPYLKWLDPATGNGYFPIVLFNFLMNGLESIIPNREKRKNHIIEKMIFMCEINGEKINTIKYFFGENANIYNIDFLSNYSETSVSTNAKFDIIIGNPPYNSNGFKKVPTNNALSKKNDGVTLWGQFIKKSLLLLQDNGYINMVVPSIWMKPDKAKMYHLLTKHKLHYIKCFTNTETNRIFKGQAQTPTCYFLMQKSQQSEFIQIYDEIYNKYVDFNFIHGSSIPLKGHSIINKLLPYTRDKNIGNFKVHKSNTPSKLNHVQLVKDINHPYINVKTTKLNKLTPELFFEYSNKPCAFYGEKKIILAHKMYGFPYLDLSGEYGISNRDNYIITGYSDEDLKKICMFLNCKLVMYIYETTRYRMKYLERYAFEFIPNILKIKNMPEITDNNIYAFFGFSPNEILFLENYHKNYGKF